MSDVVRDKYMKPIRTSILFSNELGNLDEALVNSFFKAIYIR